MSLLLGMVLLAALAIGCDDDGLGAPCERDSDCPSDDCRTGRDYPGGICTTSCRNSADCPDDWACVEKGGGTCLRYCTSDGSCRDRFGSGWACKNEKLEGEGGNISVCRGD